MAEKSEQESSQKPFEATTHRLQRAREEGQIPLSSDLNVAFMIFASAVVVLAIGPSACANIAAVLLPFIKEAHAIRIEPATLRGIAEYCAWSVGKTALLAGATFLALAIFSAALQTRFIVAWSRLKPDFSRISPKKGAGRLFSWRGGVEFLKSLLKCGVASFIVAYVLWSAIKTSANAISVPISQWFLIVRDDISRIFLYILIFMLFMGGADYLYQWILHRHQLRMTHQEMKEEFKQLEGDPHVRSKIRRLREERTRQYMEVSLQNTTVVIADSTYYAVALKYNPHMPAPVVTAKGTDMQAQTICSFARTRQIPVVEDTSLAHALYTDVKTHQEIPVEHYKAVAAVIGRIPEQKET